MFLFFFCSSCIAPTIALYKPPAARRSQYSAERSVTVDDSVSTIPHHHHHHQDDNRDNEHTKCSLNNSSLDATAAAALATAAVVRGFSPSNTVDRLAATNTSSAEDHTPNAQKDIATNRFVIACLLAIVSIYIINRIRLFSDHL